MKQLGALTFILALSLGPVTYAAPLSLQEDLKPKDDKQVTVDEQPAVAEGAKVTIGFTLMVPETRQSIPNNVSEYTPGQNEILPALEDALMGMKLGERKRVELQPEEAFGPYDEQKRMEIRRDMLPPTAKNGSIYQTSDGSPITVVSLADDTAVVDFNHPLAGKHLVIDVEVLGVEEPS